jgi:acyl-coenzyme A thioesterase PaaI-like protein
VDLEEIRAGINGLVPFQKFVGAEIVELGTECAVAVLPDSDDTLNHVGTRHAAAIFLVAEAAAGAMLASVVREKILTTVFVLRESRIAYRKKVLGEIRAVATVPEESLRAKIMERAAGERFEAVTESLLYDAAGELVAEAAFTYHCRILPG